MYKTVRISERAHKNIEALSEALNCTFLEAMDAIACGDAETRMKAAKENLDNVRHALAKDKANAALERAQQRAKELHGE